MQMKKLLFIINSLDIGGAERILLNYIQHLHTDNTYSISVLTNKSSNSFISEEVKKFATVYSIEVQISGKWKILQSIFKRQFIKNVTSSHDIIIDFLDADFCKYIKKCKKPKITWLHSSYESLLLRKKNLKEKLYCYDHIVTICKTMTNELLSREAVLQGKVSHIYNPFNFDSIDTQSVDLSELSVQEQTIINAPYYLTVCRLDESQKDVTSLLKAYRQAKTMFDITYPLVIVGDGPDYNTLKDLTQYLELQDNVYFAGMKSNPYIWMKNSYKFILSSKGEGLPTVLIEALYLGCDIISSDCKVGPSEILDDGRLGYLFNVGDVDRLSSLLNMNSTRSLNIPNEVKKYRSEFSINQLKELINKYENPKINC